MARTLHGRYMDVTWRHTSDDTCRYRTLHGLIARSRESRVTGAVGGRGSHALPEQWEVEGVTRLANGGQVVELHEDGTAERRAP